MNPFYVIQDAIQTTEDGKPFYWYGYYTNKKWTNDISEAVFFIEIEEVENRLKDDEFNFGMYIILTVYK